MKVFLVGGAVRDQLLKYPFHEKDWVVVGATPEQMLEHGFTQVGRDFPVFLHPKSKEEYALARTERKTGRGYTGFEFSTEADVTLEEDLARRDLTINAIAQDENGHIIDPYGGAEDIKSKCLRHVSPAFAEDPVRILRVARFAARYHHLGFSIASDTLELMTQMVESGEVNHLVSERVWKEFSRALLEKSPQMFIHTLRACGALKQIMPELDRLFGTPQRKEHHPEIDTGIHTLLCLERASELSDALTVRFATLMHDLGKGTTSKDILPRHTDHEIRGIPLVKALCQRLTVPNECRDLALIATEYHTYCHRAFELNPEEILQMFEKTDALRRPERFHEFLECCKADSRGRTGMEKIPYPQTEYLSKALGRLQKIEAKPLLDQGFTGKQLGEALRKQRLEALLVLQQEHSKQDL